MARQIHGVMEEPQDLDHLLTVLIVTDSKQDEMAPFYGHGERHEA